MKNRLVQSMLRNSFLFLFVFCCCVVIAQSDLNAKKITKGTVSKAEKLALDGQQKLATQYSKKLKKTNTNNSTSSTTQGNNNNSSAAKVVERCQTDQFHQQLLQDSRYVQRLRFLEDKVEQNLREGYIPCDANNTVVIPIAVHFDASYDCSNVQCLIDATEAQINSLNDDFAAINADLELYNEIIDNCGGTNVASDGACLTFCLANQNHPAASGLSDGQPAITIGQYSGSFAIGSGAPEWAGYLNIHAVSGFGGGVADGLGGALNGDGVTVGGGVFGGPNFGPCSSGSVVDDGGGLGWDLGRTLTHEVGHYLGLAHVWGDVNGGGCGGDDNISDTPDQAVPSGGCGATNNCAALATGCTAGESVQFNFMDYFDDPCLVMFSEEQALVMNTFANNVTWANDVIDSGCSDYSETCLVDCSVLAAFSPADGTNLIVCADDGSPIFLTDESQLNDTWEWTFTVTGGDLTLSGTSSTDQTPDLTIEGGTSGTVEITLEACSAAGGDCGGCETITQTYNITVASGADCPVGCDYTFTLDDTYGDTWDGAFIEVFENGTSLGIYDVPSGSQDIYVVTLTDGATIDIVYTPGAFENEHIYTIEDPFGNAFFTDGPFPGAGTSFVASCSPPVCDDGVQNGLEGGVDCGGASACADCCSNGVQDDGETGIDCGGPNCTPCPACPDGFDEIVNETFDTCMMPAGWTVTATDGGTANITFNQGPADVAGGGEPSPDFDGCIAIIDDDAGDDLGVGCIISPVIDLGAYTNTSVNFDWQHNDYAGGGDFVVEVYDGAMWVQIFIEEEDNNGTNTTLDLSSYTNADFQIRFCYDDEGIWAWAVGIDNIFICGESDGACTEEISGAILPDDPNCDVSGIEITVVAPDGTSTTIITAADGTFDLAGGPFPCGDYSASISTPIANLPPCYAEGGPTGPIAFTVDGDSATADGPFFQQNPNIPTLSQWGLIVLALLLMTFGSLTLGFRAIAFQRKRQ